MLSKKAQLVGKALETATPKPLAIARACLENLRRELEKAVDIWATDYTPQA